MSEILNIYNSATGKTLPPTPGYSAAVFTFDDGVTSLYSAVFPMFVLASAKFTGYLVSDLIETAGYITLAQAQEMNTAGHDMANHGKTHTNFTTLTQGEIETELSTCKGVLDVAGMTRASSHVAYPQGGYDADTLAAMAAQSMLSGRSTEVGYDSIVEVHDYITLHKLKAILNSSSTSLESMKDMVDEAKLYNQIIIFYAHAITGAEETKLAAILAYVQSVGMPTLTISEWYALYETAYP
jgi:peptidoglycan/xylan/chitin deacetylase (PgdA/CDA1 family)